MAAVGDGKVYSPHGNYTAMSSVYYEYPSSQPFINSDYRRDVTKPINSYPESNQQGVMSALRNLQLRLKQVERDKQQAELNLHNMKYDNVITTDINHNKTTGNISTGFLADSTVASDVHGKLLAQEERCRALERQLEHTRLMVQGAECDRSNALSRVAQLTNGDLVVERQTYTDKIADLERERLRLKASQTLAQNKIVDLEERLESERSIRQQSDNNVPDSELIEREMSTKPSRRRKKRPSSSARMSARIGRGVIGRKYPATSTAGGCSKLPGSEPPEHYHLNLNEIPFLTGKSTGPSHSLSANFQEVLSLMKSHNTKLCAGPQKHSHAHVARQTNMSTLRRTVTSSNSGATKPSVDELTELLHQLQEEFADMSREHEEIKCQMKETAVNEDLERELDTIIDRMQVKSDQITKLRQFHDSLKNRGNERKKSRVGSAGTASRLPTGRCTAGDVVTYTATRGRRSLVRPPTSCSKAQGSLSLLKDLRKIQTTLRQDDIVWDC